MQKFRTMLNTLLAVALVLGLCLVVIGEDRGDIPSSVKPTTTNMQPDQDQAAEQGFDKAERAARLAEMLADKVAATENVPHPSSTKQRNTGDDCSEPIVLNLGTGNLPYHDYDQTTCGRGNDYDNTCLGNWDGGEDTIYELNLPEDIALNILFDPKGDVYTGIMIASECPDVGGTTCIVKSTRVGSDPHGMYNLSLTAGTYYIMIDT